MKFLGSKIETPLWSVPLDRLSVGTKRTLRTRLNELVFEIGDFGKLGAAEAAKPVPISLLDKLFIAPGDKRFLLLLSNTLEVNRSTRLQGHRYEKGINETSPLFAAPFKRPWSGAHLRSLRTQGGPSIKI